MDSALQLKDIHLPPPPGVWPLAPMWWILLVFLLLICTWIALRLYRRSRRKKYRNRILAKYRLLEEQLIKQADNETIAQINTLLRQLAVNYYPRSETASLTAFDWLNFLDKTAETQEFTKGAGRILMDAPYRNGKLKNLNLDEFTPLIRGWIKKTVNQHSKQTHPVMPALFIKNRGGVS